MSTLSDALKALAAVAATDYGKLVAPVLSTAATQLTTAPETLPAIGVSLLGQLSAAGTLIAADEVKELVTLINTGVASLAAKIQTA